MIDCLFSVLRTHAAMARSPAGLAALLLQLASIPDGSVRGAARVLVVFSAFVVAGAGVEREERKEKRERERGIRFPSSPFFPLFFDLLPLSLLPNLFNKKTSRLRSTLASLPAPPSRPPGVTLTTSPPSLPRSTSTLPDWGNSPKNRPRPSGEPSRVWSRTKGSRA